MPVGLAASKNRNYFGRNPLTLEGLFRSKDWITRHLYFDNLRRRQLCNACPCLIFWSEFCHTVESNLAARYRKWLVSARAIQIQFRGDGVAVLDVL